ncbi:MAG: hypothetical protein M1840_003806 [Geoglossum simile]|nr:MAG: hypothetical protein M1840_003806 [Geoglossum simile]
MTTIADGERDKSQPICQNCTTSTTPLWRRDEIGSVLCNACGLFLKLHGRPRPISLKTDVIKSRNRVKSSGQGPKKKSLFENGLSVPRSEAGTPPLGPLDHRRLSQRSTSGGSNGSNSPLSRSGTPANPMGSHHLAPQGIFEGVTHSDHVFLPSPSLPSLHLNQPSPGSTSSLDRQHETSQSYESLFAANTSLKTRVSELEVINDLFRGRVTELEQSEATARRGEMVRRDTEEHLRRVLDDTQRREQDLKRRVDELEKELAELRESSGPPAKKMRVSDIVEESLVSTPQSTTS